MGCCIEDSQYFSAYENIKFVHNSIREKALDNKKDFYLVDTHSIENFIKTIKESNVLNYLDKPNELKNYEKKLKVLFDSYEFEKYKIYSNYNECESILDSEKKNEFIIVNKKFFDKMEENLLDNNKPQNVQIISDKNKNNIKVQFSTKEMLEIENINTIFYKFIRNNDASVQKDNYTKNEGKKKETKFNENNNQNDGSTENNYKSKDKKDTNLNNQINVLSLNSRNKINNEEKRDNINDSEIVNNNNNINKNNITQTNSNINISENVNKNNTKFNTNITYNNLSKININISNNNILDNENITNTNTEKNKGDKISKPNDDNNKILESEKNNSSEGGFYEATIREINIEKNSSNIEKSNKDDINNKNSFNEDIKSKINDENNNKGKQSEKNDIIDGGFYEATISDINNINNNYITGNNDKNIDNEEHLEIDNNLIIEKKESNLNKNEISNKDLNISIKYSNSNISEGAFIEDSMYNSKKNDCLKISEGAFIEDSLKNSKKSNYLNISEGAFYEDSSNNSNKNKEKNNIIKSSKRSEGISSEDSNFNLF